MAEFFSYLVRSFHLKKQAEEPQTESPGTLCMATIRIPAVTRDEQVRELFSLLSSGISLCLASLKTGMDEKTARKYRKEWRMPSELSERHDWRTRVDPFSAVWTTIEKQLTENPAEKKRG